MPTLRRLALITTIATYLLITVGALVRASGAGLGCPDWPKCYGGWVPPTSVEEVPVELREDFNLVKCWTEYLNRLVGVVIGFLVFATAFVAVRPLLGAGRARAGPAAGKLAKLAVAAFVLVGFQGWLGGQVVARELDPRTVSIHFFVAVLIVWLLATLCLETLADRFPRRTVLDAPTRRLRQFTMLALVATTLQMLLGAVVRGGIELEAGLNPEASRESWLQAVGWTDAVHRKVAILVLVLIAALSLAVRKRCPGRSWLAKLTFLNLGIVVGQIAAGLFLAYVSLPPVAQIVHVSFGTWVVGGLHLQWLLLGREEPAAAPAPA